MALHGAPACWEPRHLQSRCQSILYTSLVSYMTMIALQVPCRCTRQLTCELSAAQGVWAKVGNIS